MNIWEGHRLILIYHCLFQIIFHSPVSFCGSNSGIGVITIASNVGICALDVVVSDNKVTITGKMILRWSWVINIVLFCKLYVIHLLKMLYSSNLSLCESSGKNIECTLLLLWHYPSLNPYLKHDILVEKHPFQFWSFLMRNISHIHEWEILHG